MSSTGVTKGYGPYFDDDRHSDVTIIFGTDATGMESIKAHKVVLCKASDYFKGAFEGGFKEEGSPSLHLQEDDPIALRGLIAHAYGLWYDGQGNYSSTRPDLTGTETFDQLKYWLDLTVVARKYQFPAFDEAMQVHISRCASFHATYNPKRVFPGVLGEFIREVFLRDTVETAVRVRIDLICILNFLMPELRETKEFLELLKDVPDLAIGLLVMARPIQKLQEDASKANPQVENRMIELHDSVWPPREEKKDEVIR